MGKVVYSAPELEKYRHLHRADTLQITELTEKSRTFLLEIISKVQKLHNTFSNGWEFWISAPRGDYDDYIHYVLCEEELTKKERKQYKESWVVDYPDEIYWYKITLVKVDENIGISFDDNTLFHIVAESYEQAYENRYNYDKILGFINEQLDEVINKVVSNEYNDFIKNSLPYDNREGVILRRKYWAIEENNYRDDLGELSEEEVKLFFEYAEKELSVPVVSSNFRISKMNVKKYFEICSYCYKAVNFDDVENMTPKQMCERYLDRRDGGLRKIDYESYEVFEKWYVGDKSDLENTNGSHLWEISQGRTHTMIHLYLHKDEKGYYLMLAGGLHTRRDEVVKMYNELKKRNLPVGWYGIDKIVRYYKGEDKIGILPISSTPFYYWYGGFRDKEVMTFKCFAEISNKEKYIEEIEWFDEPALRLKTNDNT